MPIESTHTDVQIERVPVHPRIYKGVESFSQEHPSRSDLINSERRRRKVLNEVGNL